MRAGALVVGLALACLLGLAGGAAARGDGPGPATPDGPDPAAITAARDAVLGETRYQRDLPGRAPSAPTTSGPSRQPLPRRTTYDLPTGGGTASVLVLPLLIGLGVVLVVVLVLVVAALLRGGRPVAMAVTAPVPRAKPGATAGPAATPEGAPTATLDEPGRLAREGRFAEAIHACLLLALAALARRTGPPPPGRTSRELWRASRLPDEPRLALGALVDAVERALFAGRAPDGADYARCAAHLQGIRAACSQATA